MRRVKKRTATSPPDRALSGTLYLVSVPIGNLEDITLRALRTLQNVQIVATEDTTAARALLDHYGIDTSLTTYDHRNHQDKTEVLLDRLHHGASIALVADCGTPVIYDPGAWLIRRAYEDAIPVVVVPGPSASIAALSISGFSGDSFIFQGALPRSRKALLRQLTSFKAQRRAMVFFLSPIATRRSLEAIRDVLGNRLICLAINLTTDQEHLVRGRINQILRTHPIQFENEEVTVVVEGRRA